MAHLNGNPVPTDDRGWSEIRIEKGIAGELAVEPGEFLTVRDCYAEDLDVVLPDGESHLLIHGCIFTGRLHVRQPWTGSDLTIASCRLDQSSPIVERDEPPRLYGWLMSHRLYGQRWRQRYARIGLKAPAPSSTKIIDCLNKATFVSNAAES